MPNWSSAEQQQQQQQQQLSQSGVVWEAEATGSQGNDGRKRSHDVMTAGKALDHCFNTHIQNTLVVLFGFGDNENEAEMACDGDTGRHHILSKAVCQRR